MSKPDSADSTSVDFSLVLHGDIAYTEIRKIEVMMFRILGIVRRLSGSEDLNTMIMVIQRTISWLRQMQMMIHAIQAASGPLGWAWATVSAVSFAMTTAEASGDMYDNIRVAN